MRNSRTIIVFVILAGLVLGGCRGDLTSYIDTRVGTDANALGGESRFGKGSEEYGQTLPSVLEPNGMNFWTPQTRATERKCLAPYYYRDSLFQGFRGSHWIVGGCTQDYGSMTLFPSTDPSKVLPSERAVRFSHSDETATPSYYAVYLQGSGVFAEMTGRSRSAIFRFSYPSDAPACLIVEVNSDEGQGFIEIDTLRREIRGFNPVHRIYQGKGEAAGFAGYFVVRYYDEVKSCEVWRRDSATGACITFKRENPGRSVIVTAASSFTGIDGARRNLDAEIPNADFDAVRRKLESIWQKHLSRVRVSGDDAEMLRKFYGSMYRASFLPRTISDVDGRYPAFSTGSPIMADSRPHYDDYSMWDTYRALHPLITLLDPRRSGDMMQSLVDKYKQGGWLPIFPCWGSYTSAMIGDHCIAAMSDAIVKGVDNFDILTAYEAMRRNAFESPSDSAEYAGGKGRRALGSYLRYGYIPLEDEVKEAYHTREQTSRTLEYAYDDFALSQVALMLHRDEDYEILRKRSLNYRNVFDPASGWVGGRYADGRFCDDNRVECLSPYITEGAPCHYSWYVPHDPCGLMEVMGGRERYVEKLDSLFAENLYWHGNEPCHQVAYMYDFAGQSWKTQDQVRRILDREYGDIPGGLAGNDDAGQMSAWLVFSCLGFYPVCPATPYYMLGAPQFEKAVLQVGRGRTFTIKARMTGSDNRYVQSVTLRGKPYVENYITHSDIMKGGVMEFVMGDCPAE